MIPENILSKLPYHCSGLVCSIIINQINSDQMAEYFPPKLLKRVYDASGLFGGGYDISKKDLESLGQKALQYTINLINPYL